MNRFFDSGALEPWVASFLFESRLIQLVLDHLGRVLGRTYVVEGWESNHHLSSSVCRYMGPTLSPRNLVSHTCSTEDTYAEWRRRRRRYMYLGLGEQGSLAESEAECIDSTALQHQQGGDDILVDFSLSRSRCVNCPQN